MQIIASLPNYQIRNSGEGPSRLCFNKPQPLDGSDDAQVWEPLLKEKQSGKMGKSITGSPLGVLGMSCVVQPPFDPFATVSCATVLAVLSVILTYLSMAKKHFFLILQVQGSLDDNF